MVKHNPTGLYPVMKNKYGIVDVHTISTQPMSRYYMKKVINGPIASIEADYQAEIRKTADFRKVSKEFDPLKVLLEWTKPLSESYAIII